MNSPSPVRVYRHHPYGRIAIRPYIRPKNAIRTHNGTTTITDKIDVRVSHEFPTIRTGVLQYAPTQHATTTITGKIDVRETV
ncbi:MAG: hypothetical protein ACOYLR_08605 [Chlorobium sp.]